MTNTEELYRVVELSPAAFAANKHVSLHYVLTLMLHRERKDTLFLSSPGFVPVIPFESNEMDAVIQISFSDLLVDVFLTRHFLPVGKFLRQLNGICLFSPDALRQVKDLLLIMPADNSEKTSLQFLWVMKGLVESKPELLNDEGLLSPGSLRNALKINKVKSFVKENSWRQIREEEVAKMVGLTKTSFSRFFMQCTGMRFCEYFTWERIERASRLLQTSDDTVMGVGLSCGFSSPCYFSRTFKQYKGISPGKARTLLLESPDFRI